MVSSNSTCATKSLVTISGTEEGRPALQATRTTQEWKYVPHATRHAHSLPRPAHALLYATPTPSAAQEVSPQLQSGSRPGPAAAQQQTAATPLLPAQQLIPVWLVAQPDRYLGLSGRISAADAAILEAPSPARQSAVLSPANHGAPDGNPEGPSLATGQVCDLGLLCA